MSGHEARAVGPLARRDGEPAFDEPWQAQVLALAFHLIERGAFDGGEWSRALGAALDDAQARGEPDDAGTYYRAVLAALESLLADAGCIDSGALDTRSEAWRRAYVNTPHGEPVELSAALSRGGPSTR